MSWKKTALYFGWQSVKYAQSWSHFTKIWGSYNRWKSSVQPGRNSVDDESAWITLEALDFLNQSIRPTDRIFEYGGGGSTLFFCKRAAFVATVEHDAEWFDLLELKIKEKGCTNWKGQKIQGALVQGGKKRRPDNPSDYMSATPGMEDYSFEAYAKAIHQYEKSSFDLILVDGRSRPSCIAEALPYLKSGGTLVVDNADRQYYRKAFLGIFQRDFEVVIDRYFPCVYVPDFIITLVLRKK